MNKRQFSKLLLFTLMLVQLVSCTDDTKTGLVVQPTGDQIFVFLDTFNVKSRDYTVYAISAQCDTSTMALGEFHDKTFGTTKADLLVQLMPPVGYEFAPDSLNPVADSLVLYMYYTDWFGSETSPLEISIYEINKQDIEYEQMYLTNLDIDDFCDRSILMGKSVITSVDQSLPDSTLNADDYQPVFRYKFSDEQLKRFFEMPKSAFSSREAFLNEFKGMYITTTYGAETMMYFSQIGLKLFYHYDVERDGKDTTLNTSVTFPANREVRQLNKFSHTNLPFVATETDTLTHVKSPAGIFPLIEIPTGKIRERVAQRVGDRQYNTNSAILEVELTDIDTTSEYALPLPSTLLLMRESDAELLEKDKYQFLSYDSVACIAVYDSETQSYQFDMAYLMTHEIRKDYTNFDDSETFILVPCSAIYDSSGNLTYAISLRRLSAFSFKSGANTSSPLRLRMIYNGF